MAHVKEFAFSLNNFDAKNPFLANYLGHDGPFLFFAAYWNKDLIRWGIGFCVFDANAKIWYAGCCNSQPFSQLDAFVQDMITTIKYTTDSYINIKHLFIASKDLFEAIMYIRFQHDWGLDMESNWPKISLQWLSDQMFKLFLTIGLVLLLILHVTSYYAWDYSTSPRQGLAKMDYEGCDQV